MELCLGSPCAPSDPHVCPGGAHDPAAGEPQVPVALQEEVCDPPGQAEGPGQHPPAQPVPHPHQRRGPVHQVSAPGLLRAPRGATSSWDSCWWAQLMGLPLICASGLPSPGASRSTRTLLCSTLSSASSSRYCWWLSTLRAAWVPSCPPGQP